MDSSLQTRGSHQHTKYTKKSLRTQRTPKRRQQYAPDATSLLSILYALATDLEVLFPGPYDDGYAINLCGCIDELHTLHCMLKMCLTEIITTFGLNRKQFEPMWDK